VVHGLVGNTDLSQKVIGCAIEVHRALGAGLLESAYEQALAHELSQSGLAFQRQVPIVVHYKGVNLGCGYRADLVVEDELLIELKSVGELNDVHRAQLVSYLKLSAYPCGLLINFNCRRLRDGIQRLLKSSL